MTSSGSWRVWGRVSGAQLPRNVTVIDDITLGGPAPEPALPEPVWDLNARPTGGYCHFRSSPSQLQVFSPCYMCVDVVASSEVDAIEKVLARHVPLLQAALSLRQPTIPYRIQLVAAQDSKHRYAAPRGVQVAYFNDDPMLADGTHRVRENYRVILNNDSANRAALLLARGIALSDMGPDPATQAAALLAYYQVLEAVAQAIPWEPPADHDAQQEHILGSLRESLGAANGVRKEVEALRNAAQSLDRLDAKYTSLRIKHAAQVLGMPAEWKDAATKLGKLRNTALGHAGFVDPADLRLWFPEPSGEQLALTLAKSFLDSLVCTLVKDENSTPCVS